MANFDIPNEDELKPGVVYNYDLLPKGYEITENDVVSTYNQFIQLRDTFIFSKKKYPGKAGKRLIVWDKWDWTDTGTIEVRENNYFRQNFQPTWISGDVETKVLPEPSGGYITSVPDSLKAQYPTFGNLCCMIQKDWHYRIVHKEEVLPLATTKKVYCYVDIYRKNAQDTYEILYKWWVAVFDWQWEVSKTFSGTCTTDEGSGTATITATFTLGELFQKVTAFGYQERDLKKWDVLVLRMKDARHDLNTWEPLGNDLIIQNDSNYRSIDYLDLPYNI